MCRLKTAPVLALSFATTLLLLGIGVWVLHPLIMNKIENRRPQPAGQLQADARTLAAAVRFLLDSDSGSHWSPVPTSSFASGFAVQPLGSPPVAYSYSSNQTEFPTEPPTNRPARS